MRSWWRSTSASPVLLSRLSVTSSAAEKYAPDIRIRGELRRRARPAVVAVDQNVSPMRDGQCFVGILLHHRDGNALAIDGDDRVEQFLGRERGEAGRRLIEQ